MKQNSFTLSKQKGVQFSNLTGDINKIHIDENYAYNSIYGFTIVHGILLFSNFIKRINYYKKLKYYRSIHIYFANPTKYNELITYKNNKVNNYELFQNKKQILSINFSKEKNNIKINNLKKHIYKKNFIISKQIKKKYINNIMPIDLYICLGFLTKYVGVIFPGENSLINEIKVFKNKYFLKSKKMTVNSYVVDKRFPIIHNILLYKNYTIEFKSIIRPKLKFSFKLPSRKIIKEIKGLNRNVLIIGSSSGIGYDLMKLFMYNKK